MPIDYAGDVAAIIALGDAPAFSLAYAQGANAKGPIVSGYRLEPLDRSDGDGLDRADAIFAIPATEFTSGFSGPASITPSQGDFISALAPLESIWEVDTATLTSGSQIWLLACSKRIPRGTT